MVRLGPGRLDKRDLDADFGAHPPAVFERFGLDLGETVVTDDGETLRVTETARGDQWYLAPADDGADPGAGLTGVLSDLPFGDAFVADHTPRGSGRRHRLDYALPVVRYAIEVHDEAWWVKTPGTEPETSAILLNDAWDLLWVPRGLLGSHDADIAAAIETQLREILRERLTVTAGEAAFHVEKEAPHDGCTVAYSVPRDDGTVPTLDGRERPAEIATLDRHL